MATLFPFSKTMSLNITNLSLHTLKASIGTDIGEENNFTLIQGKTKICFKNYQAFKRLYSLGKIGITIYSKKISVKRTTDTDTEIWIIMDKGVVPKLLYICMAYIQDEESLLGNFDLSLPKSFLENTLMNFPITLYILQDDSHPTPYTGWIKIPSCACSNFLH